MGKCFNCDNCGERRDGYYIFNSTLLTIFIAAGAFLVAFAWNKAVKTSFERMTDKHDELHAMYMYAIVITIAVIIFCFLLMFYLNGEKW